MKYILVLTHRKCGQILTLLQPPDLQPAPLANKEFIYLFSLTCLISCLSLSFSQAVRYFLLARRFFSANDGNFRENDGKWQEMTRISAWMTKVTEISVISQAQFIRCPAINFYLCSSSGDELCAMPVLLRWPSSNLIAEEKFLVQGERSPRIIKRQVLVLQ